VIWKDSGGERCQDSDQELAGEVGVPNGIRTREAERIIVSSCRPSAQEQDLRERRDDGNRRE